MAWRDTRTSRGRLLLFSSSIVLGVAALAAIGSLGTNLERAVEEQARTLLGADLAISSRQAFSAEEEALFQDIGGEQSRETSFSSMIYFPASGGTRLAQVRALSGGFPFYGRLETEPPGAEAAFRQGRGALVEQNLLIQFGAKVGDNIRLGQLTLPVVGELRKVPGESAALAVVAPRVYLPMEDLPARRPAAARAAWRNTRPISNFRRRPTCRNWWRASNRNWKSSASTSTPWKNESKTSAAPWTIFTIS